MQTLQEMWVLIMMSFYNNNKDFKEFVDKYCDKYVEGRKITVQEALTHELVKEVAVYYGKMDS